MDCRVIGVRNVEFEKNGRQINGKSVYFTYTDRNVSGYACDKVFLNERILSDIGWTPVVDDEFRPIYNRYGRINDVELM